MDLKYFLRECHDLNFGLATNAKGWKGVGWECHPGVIFALLKVWGNEPTHSQVVATLALGSRLRQGLAKVQAKSEVQESHFMLSKVQESAREWTFTLPSEPSFWELEFQWTPKFSKGDCRGSLDWKVLYIIGNLLELKCLKWVCMTHLGT
jgi:hypothetical protein